MAVIRIPTKEPLYSNNFLISFQLPAAVAQNNQDAGKFSTYVTALCRNIEVPPVALARKNDSFGGITFHYRGNLIDFKEITASFRATRSLTLYDLWRDWVDYMRNFRGDRGFIGAHGVDDEDTDYYTTTGFIQIIDSARNIVKVYALVRMFPTNIAGLSMKQASDELISFNVTLSFDFIIPIV